MDIESFSYLCSPNQSTFKQKRLSKQHYLTIIRISVMTNFSQITDEQLALRYVDGDNKAFDELLKRTQSKLYDYIFFIVKDSHIADDIFQDTFIRVIDNLQKGRYKESGKFMGFLLRIAHNLIMDHFRKKKNQKVIESDNDLEKECYKLGGNTDSNREDQYIRDRSMTELNLLMNALPESQREVVYLRCYQNLSFKEIAEKTSCSINTALGRMRYATLNMRKMARNYGLTLTNF